MAVYVSEEIAYYSRESVKVYASGVHSGIVGHPGTNTYHQSIENLPNKSGYTNYWKNDKSPPGEWSRQYACADDLSMSRQDMITDWKRHKKVFDDKSDPRRKYFAEYIGTPDGITAYRLDFADDSVEESDDSHTWHAHGACWRCYFNSMEAQEARLSVRRGETKEQYQGKATKKGRKMVVSIQRGSDVQYWWTDGLGRRKQIGIKPYGWDDVKFHEALSGVQMVEAKDEAQFNHLTGFTATQAAPIVPAK